MLVLLAKYDICIYLKKHQSTYKTEILRFIYNGNLALFPTQILKTVKSISILILFIKILEAPGNTCEYDLDFLPTKFRNKFFYVKICFSKVLMKTILKWLNDRISSQLTPYYLHNVSVTFRKQYFNYNTSSIYFELLQLILRHCFIVYEYTFSLTVSQNNIINV